ncbi:MAG: regulatory protein [Candidatus Marinimicrobia bacterium]|jgi:regulatory protein|nr:regulatory protein [Candidatus Neomarinimicrobiota bacterium]
MILQSLKYQKRRKEWLLIFDTGETLSVNDELKTKYGLQPAMNIGEERYITLKNEAERQSAFEKAIELLSYREHSSHELKTKLTQKGFSSSLVQDILRQMMAKGYLDDERFATLYFRELMRQRNYGPLMIKKKMMEKGVEGAVIDAKLNTVQAEEWEQIAREILHKKRQKLRKHTGNLRDTVLGILTRKGFSYGNIQNVVNEYEKKEE